MAKNKRQIVALPLSWREAHFISRLLRQNSPNPAEATSGVSAKWINERLTSLMYIKGEK